MMGGSLSAGDRIEIRGFGSFSLHYRPPRLGRNPKTGESVALPGKHVPHFKPGKELRERVSSVLPLDADPAITFMDIGSVFLSPDGTLSKDIMPDFLHPNRRGHELWADAIEPVIRKYVPVRE